MTDPDRRSIDQDRLTRLLRELHEQLHTVASVDPANRDLMRRLTGELNAIMETGAAQASAEQYGGLRDRLTEAATAFEATHPRLAKAMENTIETLRLYNL